MEEGRAFYLGHVSVNTEYLTQQRPVPIQFQLKGHQGSSTQRTNRERSKRGNIKLFPFDFNRFLTEYNNLHLLLLSHKTTWDQSKVTGKTFFYAQSQDL